MPGIKENRKHTGCSPSCACSLFPYQEAEIEHIFEIQAYFQYCLIWAENTTIWKFYIYSLSTRVVMEIELIFTLLAAVSEKWSDFQNILILSWKLAIGKSSKSCKYTLFLPQKVEIVVLTLHAEVSEIRTDFQNCNIWAWNLSTNKSSRSCAYALFLPQAVEIERIFSPYGPRYGPRIKIAIWAWNLQWPLAKGPEIAHTVMQSASTPGCRNWAFLSFFLFIVIIFFTLGAAWAGNGFWDTGWFSKLPYLGMQLGHWQKVPEVTDVVSFYPRGSKLSLFSGFRNTGWFTKCHKNVGMKPGKSPRRWTYTICLYPSVEAELTFAVRAKVIQVSDFFLP